MDTIVEGEAKEKDKEIGMPVMPVVIVDLQTYRILYMFLQKRCSLFL